MAKEVVVFLPGIMGSVLKDGADVIWPGTPSELVFKYKKMAQLLKPDLVVADIIRKVSISEQYDAIVDSLATCGFKESDSPPTLCVCPYDWRKDNALAAALLAKCVSAAVAAHGDAVEITLVAHSMGGLVCRYYLESGAFAAQPGFDNIKRLITLGTPHRGAPLAIQAAMGLIKRLFLSKEQVKTISNDDRFPSLYQLLPPQGEPFAWDESANNRFAPIDVYSAAVAAKLGLSAKNLDAARQFHAKLDLAKRPKGVTYFCFCGTRQQTVSEVRVDLSIPRLRAEERADAGDGTVPLWSGSQSGLQAAPVGGEHGGIYKDPKLKQILGVLLGKPGALATVSPFSIALKDPVVTVGTTTRAELTFSQPISNIDGRLEIEMIVDSAGSPVLASKAAQTQPIKYSGAPVDRLSLKIVAPDFRGIYRVQFVQELPGPAVATDDLIVQEA